MIKSLTQLKRRCINTRDENRTLKCRIILDLVISFWKQCSSDGSLSLSDTTASAIVRSLEEHVAC